MLAATLPPGAAGGIQPITLTLSDPQLGGPPVVSVRSTFIVP